MGGGTWPAPGPETIFDCTVTIPASQPIWLRTYGNFHFKKAITALSIIGRDTTDSSLHMRWSEGGRVFLYSPSNYLNRANVYSPTLICEADEVLGGARGRIEFKSLDWSGGGVGVDLKGHSQTIKSVATYTASDNTTRSKVLQGTGNFHAVFSTGGAATLTLLGEDTDRATYASLNNEVSLTLNATNRADYTQTFNGRTSQMTGSITVNRGILKMMHIAGFPNASSVTVGSEGKIVVDSTMTIDAFANVPSLTLNGELEVKSNAATPFVLGEATLELGDAAKVNLPDGVDLSFKTVTTNGVPVPGGTKLDASMLPGVFTGAGGIIVLSAGAIEWTAEGTDDSVWTPGNWSDPSVVDRLGASSVKASFGTGTRAVVSGALALTGIRFDAPDGFTMKGDGPTTLAIGPEALTIGASETARTFAIEDVAISVAGTQNWTVPSNQTLRVKDGIVSQSGTVIIKGTGNLTLEGTNTFTGGIKGMYEGTNMPLVTVSGLLATPNHEDQGQPTGDDGKSLYLNFDQDIGALSQRVLCVSNAVIEKPVAFRNRIGVPSIWSPNNTTNEFRGQVRYLNSAAWHKVIPGSRSELIFSGGLEATHSFRNFGSGTIRLRGKPCKFNALAGLNPSAGMIIVENTGNSFLNVVLGYENNNYPKVQFAVSGAMTNGNLIAGYSGGSLGALSALSGGTYTVDLMEGTTQRCATVAFAAKSVLQGAYPAMLEVFGNNPMSTDEDRKHCFAGQVQGGVGFHMCGTGTLLLAASGAYHSTGDLAVSSGTLELENGAVWANGQKVSVKGTGTLKVNAANALGNGKTEMFVRDSWMLDIPAGCTLTVHALRDMATGKYLPSGTYGRAGSGAKHMNLAAHFAGDGLLYVRRRCTTLSFR